MRALVTFALQKRALVILLFIAFLGIGFAGFQQLNIEAYPDPVPPTVVVITQNAGQSAEEIERYITVPIEVGLAGMPNLSKIRSTSLFGLSVVSVQFTYAFNYEQSLQQVLNRLGQLSGLPTGVQPQISPWSPIGEILRYRIVGPPGFNLTDLRVLQDWVLQRRFKRVPGVIDVTAYGGPTKSYNVIIDLPKLIAFGLDVPTVVQAIGNGDATVGAGIVNIGPQSAVVQGVGLIRSLDDVRNVVLTASSGVPVLLSDVARVEVSNLPRLGIAGQERDDDIVMGVVLMRRNEQTLPTITAVQQEVATINAGGVLPPGVRIVPIYDRKELVDVTTHHVVKNIIMGILLVVFIQWLFLGDLRGAIVVGATIPFAFFTAVVVMLLRGESANLLSLGSLDFGLLVDATVIMVENVYRHLHMRHSGLNSPPAATRGLSGVPLIVQRASGEVSTAIFFSALIIVAAFIPLFTMGGIEGRIFGPMAKTYAYAIGGALFATFTVAPALAGALFSDHTKEKVMPIVRYMGQAHQYLYGRAIRHRWRTIGLSGVLMLLAVLQFGKLGGEFLPTLEEGSIWMRATMPATISLEEGNGYVNRMRAALMEFPEVTTITSQQGRPDDGTDSAGFFNAEFFVPLKPQDQWTSATTKDALISLIQARLQREFLGVDFNFSQYISDNVQEAASGVKGANALKVIGPELDILTRLAEQVRREMEQVEGIADLAAFRTLGQPTLSIRIDRARAARYGLQVADINSVIQTAIGGQEAARLYEEGGDRNFPISVRLDAPYRIGRDAISRIPINATSGATIGDVADIRLITGASYIYREDAQRYVPVKFSVRGRDQQSAVQEAEDRVNANVQLPPGYRLEWVGEFRNLKDAIARLKVVVPVALALIGVLLYVQFSSLRDTLLIFGLLPLSCVGGVTALDLMDLHFSVPAAIGFLALFGITVMEGIILLSHFHHLKDGGMAWRQALDQAGVDRMRPVMMTCLAAMVGLLPAAVASGIGSDLQKPLAVVVVGGTIILPFFILVVFPAMIDLFGRTADSHAPMPGGATHRA
jgi:cobalt-zinc-cadmium resistance protein CzcA